MFDISQFSIAAILQLPEGSWAPDLTSFCHKKHVFSIMTVHTQGSTDVAGLLPILCFLVLCKLDHKPQFTADLVIRVVDVSGLDLVQKPLAVL